LGEVEEDDFVAIAVVFALYDDRETAAHKERTLWRQRHKRGMKKLFETKAWRANSVTQP
jgi:hypothetical protein